MASFLVGLSFDRHDAVLQALVLVHEELDIRCAMPYHAVRLAPMPVLEMCGKSYDLEPTVKKEEAVWSWWQDLFSKVTIVA